MKKVVRNILCVAGVIILLVLSSIGGMYIERNHQETLEINNWITRIIDSAATQDIITDIKEKMVDFIKKLGDSIEELFVPDQPCELQGGA